MTEVLRPRRLIIALLLLAAALLMAFPAFAQNAPAAGQPGALDRAVNTIAGDGKPLSLSLQILLLMSLLTVLPSLVLMMTSFTRIIIVLSILRQALGLQQTPPNQVLVGLASGRILRKSRRGEQQDCGKQQQGYDEAARPQGFRHRRAAPEACLPKATGRRRATPRGAGACRRTQPLPIGRWRRAAPRRRA